MIDISWNENIKNNLSFIRNVICLFCDWASLQQGVSGPVTNSFKAKLYCGEGKEELRWNKKPELLLFPWG